MSGIGDPPSGVAPISLPREAPLDADRASDLRDMVAVTVSKLDGLTTALVRVDTQIADVRAEWAERRNEKKAFYQEPHFWSSLVAVVSVVLTTIGSLVVQMRVKEHEQLLNQSEAALRASKEYSATLTGILGRVMQANEDRLYLATGEYDDLADSVRTAIVRRTNEVDESWRRDRASQAFLIRVHYRDAASLRAWELTRSAIDAYTKCVEDAYLSAKRPSAETACKGEVATATAAIDRLEDALVTELRSRES